MIDGNDFLTLADVWITGRTEAEWRSAVSRAYYAAFHKGRQLLRDLRFLIPRGDQAHACGCRIAEIPMSNSQVPT